MTRFTPKISLLVATKNTILEHDVRGIPGSGFPIARDEEMRPSPLLPGLVAAHIAAHDITIERPANADEDGKNELNRSLESTLRAAVAEVSGLDRYTLSGEIPVNWRVTDEGWAPVGPPGLAFRMARDGQTTFRTDRTEWEYWVGIQDPDDDFWRALEQPTPPQNA